MGTTYDFDYIIIGSGPAGRMAATKLAKARKKIAIVEKNALGGAEINTRDLPYQVALNFAHNYRDFVSSPSVAGSSQTFNFPTFTAHIDRIISNARSNITAELNELGVTIINGTANFIDSHTIAVEDKKITAKYFIIATGTKLKTAEIAGIESVNFLTPTSALHVRRLPRYIFVAGGGSTGVEIAEFFANLGSKVIIMERGPRLLPREDEDVSNLVTDYLTNKLGITVITNAKVVQIAEDQTSKIAVFTTGASEKMVRVESIILATGSEPILDYSLENAGVDYKHSGIIVDKFFNTSAKNIFAIGDCLGPKDSSTERAHLEARILTQNLLHRNKFTAKYSGIIRHTDTKINIATVGLNEIDATSRDLKYKKSIINLKNVPSIHSPEYQDGFVKLLVNHSGYLIGATVVSKDANHIIEELAVALTHRISLETLISTPHPIDTPAAAIPLAIQKILTK